jgi:hypothetical protein
MSAPRTPKRWLLQAAGLAAALYLTLNLQCAHADSYPEDSVKAAFLYRFAGYVEWPRAALATPTFTIAVLGGQSVAAQLERLLPSHKIKNRPSQVRQIDAPAELKDAQVLYIGADYNGDLRSLIEPLASKPVLIVTDSDRGLSEGGTVNFLSIDRRVRFEVSLTAATRSGLKIGSELLSVAARVEGDRLRSGVSCGENALAGSCTPRVAIRSNDATE